jgi:feruloyl esterase
MASCDAVDGVKDGVIGDPRKCHFNPASLACHGTDTANCLTPAELEAAKKVYDGLKNPHTGEQIFPGWPLGSEGFGDTAAQGWGQMINIPEPRRVEVLKYFVFDDPNWDWNTIDFDKDTAYADAKIGFISATNPDLKAFKARGGKLVMYTGWVDPILPAQDVVRYYEEVSKTMGGAAKTTDFFRLFMVPGMAHCSGGPGTTSFDMMPALEQWVEKGGVPQRVIASRITRGVADRTRPLCPYPQVAKWKGVGSTDDAANFVCAPEDQPAGRGSTTQ